MSGKSYDDLIEFKKIHDYCNVDKGYPKNQELAHVSGKNALL